MGYIYGLVVVFLFFISLHYFTELTKQQKLVAVSVVVLLVGFAIVYNENAKQEQQHTYKIITKFNQNKTIVCENQEINKTNFSLSLGTFTFIGKENTPFYGQMIGIANCK